MGDDTVSVQDLLYQLYNVEENSFQKNKENAYKAFE